MATFQELKDALEGIKTGVEGLDAKADEIRAFIAALKAGQPVTQAQLDELKGIADGIGTHLANVHTEVDDLDA